MPTIRARAARRWSSRACAVLVSLAVAAQPVFPQAAAPAAPAPGEAAPTRLEIKILSPVPMLEPAGALSANHVAVQIVDGWGMPTPGATVSFRLPEAGPGGVFLNGLSTEVAITDREGRAAVQGFDWRAEPGTSFLHIIAAYGAVRAGAMVELRLTPRTPNSTPRPVASGREREPAETANPSIFPLPEESRVVRRTAAPPNGGHPGEPPRGGMLGRQASEGALPHRAQDAVPSSKAPAPREIRAEAPADDYSASTAAGPPGYVTVKRKSGGGRTLLILGVVAAAAGGALVAGMVSRGSSQGTGGNASPSPAGIVIGSPSITVSGAGR